jgi:putative membrane protein
MYYLDMMGDLGTWGHMSWMFPFFGFWGFFIWAIFLIVGYMVYQDAEKRGMNGALWFILIIIPWIGFISLLFYLIIRETATTKETKYKTPEDILNERYAKGEISREEYLKMKEDLKNRR